MGFAIEFVAKNGLDTCCGAITTEEVLRDFGRSQINPPPPLNKST